jgi:hypothetical protein
MRQSGVAKAIFRFDREALVPCKTERYLIGLAGVIYKTDIRYRFTRRDRWSPTWIRYTTTDLHSPRRPTLIHRISKCRNRNRNKLEMQLQKYEYRNTSFSGRVKHRN